MKFIHKSRVKKGKGHVKWNDLLFVQFTPEDVDLCEALEQ